jgi:NAD-dependent deacetylase
VRPHIVWFGELPLEMDRIYRALDHCDLFVAIGTSGHVYPAAGFVEAAAPGARTVELNLESSLVASAFQEARTGLATDLVPAFVSELLGG